LPVLLHLYHLLLLLPQSPQLLLPPSAPLALLLHFAGTSRPLLQLVQTMGRQQQQDPPLLLLQECQKSFSEQGQTAGPLPLPLLQPRGHSIRAAAAVAAGLRTLAAQAAACCRCCCASCQQQSQRQQ
jgi:hypothetical protein